MAIFDILIAILCYGIPIWVIVLIHSLLKCIEGILEHISYTYHEICAICSFIALITALTALWA